jgi:hypothetical protein
MRLFSFSRPAPTRDDRALDDTSADGAILISLAAGGVLGVAAGSAVTAAALLLAF